VVDHGCRRWNGRRGGAGQAAGQSENARERQENLSKLHDILM
jgi:hypothetical protein